MEDRWIVRVGDREYGAVDLATLIDWKREGRLVPANDARRETETAWTKAGAIPGLFAPPPLPPTSQPSLDRRRTSAEIVRDSVRIYKSAFIPFLLLTLLVAIPMLALELTSPAYGIFHQPGAAGGLTPANAIALIAIILLVVSWPIFLAGIQLATIEVLEGRPVFAGELFRRAINFFPRFARLSVIVYGSYLFWTAIPVILIISLVSATASIVTVVLALFLLGLQVVMVARLWVNFMFWQQSAVVSGYEGAEAIGESKLLARSQRRPRKSERPLWRGALLASIWFLVVLGLSSGAQLPIVISRFQNLTSPADVLALFQSLNNPKAADLMLIASAVIGGAVHALVRPMLGIAFVLLYFDARADFTEAELMRKKDQ